MYTIATWEKTWAPLVCTYTCFRVAENDTTGGGSDGKNGNILNYTKLAFNSLKIIQNDTVYKPIKQGMIGL